MTRHLCHARSGTVPVPPEMFMVKAHWYQLPRQMRRKISSFYRRGQCDDKRPSQDWLHAAREAIEHIPPIHHDTSSRTEDTRTWE